MKNKIYTLELRDSNYLVFSKIIEAKNKTLAILRFIKAIKKKFRTNLYSKILIREN